MVPQTGNPLLETSSSETPQPQVDFKFYKSQEIPEFRYSLDETPPSEDSLSKALSEDYLDFLVTVTDNGDDKLCLSGKYFHPHSNSDSPGGANPVKPLVHPVTLPADPHRDPTPACGVGALLLLEGDQDQADRKRALLQEQQRWRAERGSLRLLLPDCMIIIVNLNLNNESWHLSVRECLHTRLT